MGLTILHPNAEPTGADLVRFFHRTELHWCRHLGEEAALDAGTAICNPSLAAISAANSVRDAAIPAGMSPDDAIAMVDAHFAQHASRCACWVINPSLTPQAAAPLVDRLIASGYEARPDEILHLGHMPRQPVAEVGGLRIIPARASYRHVRILAGELGQNADAWEMHLDDPHWDCLLALADDRPAATIGVLAAGDLGRIEQHHVAEPFRNRGIGRTMMSRALEICARSLFKHVFIRVDAGNARAIDMYQRMGFERVGAFVEYVRK